MLNFLNILPIILLLAFQNINAQENSQEDLIGTWQVSRCEVFNEGRLIKTGTFNATAFDNKQVEGNYAGKIEEEVNQIIKEILGAKITLNSDSTISSDVSVKSIGFSNEHWKLNPTGELVVFKNKSRNGAKPVLFSARVVFMSRSEIQIIYFDSGFELRLFLSLN